MLRIPRFSRRPQLLSAAPSLSEVQRIFSRDSGTKRGRLVRRWGGNYIARKSWEVRVSPP